MDVTVTGEKGEGHGRRVFCGHCTWFVLGWDIFDRQFVRYGTRELQVQA